MSTAGAGSSGVAPLLIVGCLVAFARSAAHELERTRVSLAFAGWPLHPRHRERPGVAAAAAGAVPRDYPGPGPPGAPADAGGTRRAAGGDDGGVRDRLVLFVDGREVRPGSGLRVPAAPRPAAARRCRAIPAPRPGAARRAPTALVLRHRRRPLPVAILRADGQAYAEWISGTVWSGPIDLTGQFVPPTRRECCGSTWRSATRTSCRRAWTTSCSSSGCSCCAPASARCSAGHCLHGGALAHPGPGDLRRGRAAPAWSSP